MIIFCISTKWDYTYPDAVSLNKFMTDHERVKTAIMTNIKDGEKICLVGFSPLTFLYNSQFHPNSNYSIKSEFLVEPDYIKEKCGDRRIIYNK